MADEFIGGTRPLFCAQTVIGVIGAFSHSIGPRVKALQGRDWVIGEKAGNWVEEGDWGAGDCFYSRWHKLVVEYARPERPTRFQPRAEAAQSDAGTLGIVMRKCSPCKGKSIIM